ncbi:G1 family glutamic endopeptidase [Pseudonocardia adelaidensis]|uniref:Peptidase A4-like protein n=1 Tax=Pseudonocardia adelaidensis TaxID=648754 RepID=A0ABP9NKF6_9PSEU
MHVATIDIWLRALAAPLPEHGLVNGRVGTGGTAANGEGGLGCGGGAGTGAGAGSARGTGVDDTRTHRREDDMRGASGNPTDGARIRGLLLSVLGVGALLIAPGAAGPGAPPTAAAVRTSSELPDTRPPASQLGGGFSANGGNWSGYVATGKGLRSVSARWAEPVVTCTSTAETFSPWVGIDGYGSGTVQQAGVATDCSSGKPVYRAWYETAPEPPVYYPLAVHAGDEVTAEVARSGSTYTMRISDVTRNWTRSAIKSFQGNNVSAEVVLEALAGRFPRFGEVAFTHATVDGKPLGSAKPIAIDATDATGFLTATGPLSGGSFAVRPLRE